MIYSYFVILEAFKLKTKEFVCKWYRLAL